MSMAAAAVTVGDCGQSGALHGLWSGHDVSKNALGRVETRSWKIKKEILVDDLTLHFIGLFFTGFFFFLSSFCVCVGGGGGVALHIILILLLLSPPF